MVYIKSLLRSIAIGVALASELAIALSIITMAPGTATTQHEGKQRVASHQTPNQTASPPPRRNPGSSVAGGRRNSNACPQDGISETTSLPLIPLSPMTGTGLTLEARPTFLVYVPRTSAETAEFSLSTRDGRGIYRTTIPLTHTPDIVSIPMPDQTEPLEVGRPYMWVFAIICNPNRRMADQFVISNIERTALDPVRLRQIEQTPIRQRIALYQEDGIWYDALNLLFELKRNQPNDPEIDAAWREFLNSEGVDTMIEINSARSR
ncbi:DUF928 domain-containing protein [Oscillatoria sp. FACHB-1407]|uniref:DUF928 domain-containing protein n=1 Tax=Oscillatoria sp. FACHB-1407 TaxID=2692847 RepID=UPI001684DF8E|nr:DUF928 domain-containing protein [Oscillatoria sp. FACHB-1407]MBD2463572.1 DUF928 domain-containing protein [Oscillatoria sp. FACHB-1407]